MERNRLRTLKRLVSALTLVISETKRRKYGKWFRTKKMNFVKSDHGWMDVTWREQMTKDQRTWWKDDGCDKFKWSIIKENKMDIIDQFHMVLVSPDTMSLDIECYSIKSLRRVDSTFGLPWSHEYVTECGW